MSPDAPHRAATAVPPEAGNAPAGHLVNLSEATVLKAGNVFAVAERDGSVPLAPGHPLGVYLEDCRFLSGHELWLSGVRPRLLVTSAGLGSAAVHELTNPPLTLDDGSMLPLQTLQ